MVAKILFLSAAAFMAYRYITKSNQKVRELTQNKQGSQMVLPPATEESARVVHKPSRAVLPSSSAVEPDPGR